jgi:hypothetical protein
MRINAEATAIRLNDAVSRKSEECVVCNSEDCRCEVEMISTYEKLVAQGLPPNVAFARGANIYRYHHPESTAFEAVNAVKEVLSQQTA